MRARRKSRPSLRSKQWNHKAHRDTAIRLRSTGFLNRCVRARSKRDKRVLLLTANRTARTRTGRTVGSKPERPCRDEKNRWPDPRVPLRHCYSAERLARCGPAVASDSMGIFAIPHPRVSPPRNWDKRLSQVRQAAKPE